jgi:hypothetical protein
MKFKEYNYKPYKEIEQGENTVYLYADDDMNECAVVVDKDDNIISDSTTGECACRGCRD